MIKADSDQPVRQISQSSSEPHIISNSLNRDSLDLAISKKSYLCCDPASQTVSYENINMDHISGLCHEGFNKPAVVRALLISRNDVTLARDILQEYSSKKC